MTHSESYETHNPRQYAQEVLTRSQEALGVAITIMSPETSDADPLDVFPAPAERRADDPGLDLDERQERALRETVAGLGFGRESNRTMSELGISSGHVILEGGQAHKMMAEALLVVSDKEAAPASITLSASPFRKVAGAEAELTSRVLGIAEDQLGATEYDVARQVAERVPGYVALVQEEVLPVAYDIDNGFAVSEQSSGQLVTIGHIGAAPVLLLRVDRENYVDDTGKPKYRNQPGTADIIVIVDSALSNKDTTPVAFVTSGTYQASREVDGARAALVTGRAVGIPTYGTAQLAMIKGETVPAPGPINQLPGELHKMAVQIAALKAVLEEQA